MLLSIKKDRFLIFILICVFIFGLVKFRNSETTPTSTDLNLESCEEVIYYSNLGGKIFDICFNEKGTYTQLEQKIINDWRTQMFHDVPVSQLIGMELEDVKEHFPNHNFEEVEKDGNAIAPSSWEEVPWRIRVATEDGIIIRIIGFN